MESTSVAPPIEIPSNFTSAVDIIIPFHGQYEKLTTLMQSIFRLTRSNYYKICIVDDASPNAHFVNTIKKNAVKNATRRKGENIVQTIRLEKQVGFAAALKAGFDATSSPYVCFINSDCKIEDVNWLRAMGECLLESRQQNVMMVSPMTNNAVGGHPAQEADKTYRNEEPEILGEGEYLSLYCFMCHRDLFKYCGGFLKEYPYGYYEDVEIVARLQKHGYKQAVCRMSWVHHEGQATLKAVWAVDPKVKSIMEVSNRKRCIEDMK